MNEIAKYNNSLNGVSFRKFNSREFDMFFALCYKLKEQGTDTIEISFEEIKQITHYKFTGKDRFIKDLDSVYKKMLELNFKFEDDEVLERFTLFSSYKIYKEKGYLEVSVNPKFDFILNALESNFTRFELQEFTSLRSGYSKSMYRLLKQWRTIGKRTFLIDEFKDLLDIPNSYGMTNIDKKVLDPIKKELSPYFKDLKITKIKKGRGRGGKVVEILFEFTPQGHRAEAKARLKEEFGENYEENLPKVTMHNWLNVN